MTVHLFRDYTHSPRRQRPDRLSQQGREFPKLTLGAHLEDRFCLRTWIPVCTGMSGVVADLPLKPWTRFG